MTWYTVDLLVYFNWNFLIYGIILRSSFISFDELYNHLFAHDKILDQWFGNSMFNVNLAKFGGLNRIHKLNAILIILPIMVFQPRIIETS